MALDLDDTAGYKELTLGIEAALAGLISGVAGEDEAATT
jgi:hypothetical protein